MTNPSNHANLRISDILERDARILYDLTVAIITCQGEAESKRKEDLAQKHVDAMLRRHGEATTQRAMEAVHQRIAEIVAKNARAS